MFSSTSSSEFCLDNHFNNNNFIPLNFGRNQQFSGLTQPLIYYTEIKPKRRKQRGENQSDKPNFFAKAFHWYTQELAPLKENASSNDVDICGFPSWLDDKYNQYIQSSRIEQHQCILNQASAIETANATKNYDDKTKTSKIRSRLRSPWSKRRKSLIGDDKADFKVKSSQSIEIIFKQKNLRPASACCQSSLCKTDSPVQLDKNDSHEELKPKSQSLTSLIRKAEIYVIPLDVLEDINYKELKHNPNVVRIKDKKTLKLLFSKNDNRTIENQKNRDVSCQCSNVTLGMIDASCQVGGVSNICRCETKPAEDAPKNVTAFNEFSNIEYDKTNINYEKFSHCVQTSDHSILLCRDIQNNDPLFVKIICADKLHENFK